MSPILLATRELSHNAITIFSGQRLDVLPEKGLVGECDFILANSPPVPTLHGPLVTLVEAKKNDIELGMGQCIAQMVGARSSTIVTVVPPPPSSAASRPGKRGSFSASTLRSSGLIEFAITSTRWACCWRFGRQ